MNPSLRSLPIWSVSAKVWSDDSFPREEVEIFLHSLVVKLQPFHRELINWVLLDTELSLSAPDRRWSTAVWHRSVSLWDEEYLIPINTMKHAQYILNIYWTKKCRKIFAEVSFITEGHNNVQIAQEIQKFSQIWSKFNIWITHSNSSVTFVFVSP